MLDCDLLQVAGIKKKVLYYIDHLHGFNPHVTNWLWYG